MAFAATRGSAHPPHTPRKEPRRLRHGVFASRPRRLRHGVFASRPLLVLAERQADDRACPPPLCGAGEGGGSGGGGGGGEVAAAGAAGDQPASVAPFRTLRQGQLPRGGLAVLARLQRFPAAVPEAGHARQGAPARHVARAGSPPSRRRSLFTAAALQKISSRSPPLAVPPAHTHTAPPPAPAAALRAPKAPPARPPASSGAQAKAMFELYMGPTAKYK
eukprot:5856640-Prymnesium_polylepis.1